MMTTHIPGTSKTHTYVSKISGTRIHVPSNSVLLNTAPTPPPTPVVSEADLKTDWALRKAAMILVNLKHSGVID